MAGGPFGPPFFFSAGARITARVQHPLSLGDRSEPEPDLAVVAGSPRDFADRHPSTAALIVEVADSSLEHDRTRKARVYSQAGIAEYWIVNLGDEHLEVRRDPGPDGYRSLVRLGRGDTAAPAAAGGAAVAVADLLP